MQRLTEAPRAGFAEDVVRGLLVDNGTDYAAGCELLDQNLTVLEDISDDFDGGTVKRNMSAKIHGTCDVTLSRELTWGNVLVRPYMLLSRPGLLVPARFNCGAFSLETPKRVYGDSTPAFECQGADRLYLLDRDVGDTYEVPADANVLDSVRQVFVDAGLSESTVLLDGTASDKTLPEAMTWPLVAKESADGTGSASSRESGPATWLRIINDLLATINYRGVWCDQDGNYRSEPYASPTQRPVEWMFDEGLLTGIQAPGRELTRDMWKAPNRWVFVQTNRPTDAPPPTWDDATGTGDGIYIYDNEVDGPTSQQARGLVWPKQYELDVADQASLVAAGNAQVEQDLRVTATWNLSTASLPIAGHADVATLVADAVGRKVQAASWSLPLDGSDMSWAFDEVG